MKSVTIAIPSTGRMCIESLEWFASMGAIDADWQKEVSTFIDTGRKKPGEEEIKQEIMERWKSGKNGVTLKYDPRSGYRASFLVKEGEIAGIPIILYGAEAPASNAIMQSEADIAIVGFDSLLASLVNYLKPESQVRSWTGLNDALIESSTDVRVAKETGMSDYAGWFLLAPSWYSASYRARIDGVYGVNYTRQSPTEMIMEKGGVFAVKGMFEGLAYYFLGDKVKGEPTENIEEAVKAGMFGLDIVRTGRTIVENRLYISGAPFLITKSVVTVDRGKYQSDKRNDLLSTLKGGVSREV